MRAVFEPGAIDDDFDASLLTDASRLDPLIRELNTCPDVAAQAGFASMWPDDLVLLGGTLAPGNGPGALLVPRATPTIAAAFFADSEERAHAAHIIDGATVANNAAGVLCFTHCGVLITAAKHAPPPASMTESLRQSLRGGAAGTAVATLDGVTGSDDASSLSQPRAAARLSHFVSQQPRFAQPGTLEFDFASEWRKMQVGSIASLCEESIGAGSLVLHPQNSEDIERALLAALHEERRAHLLARQRAAYADICVGLQV